MSKPYIRKPPYPAQFREQMIELVRAGCKPGELTKEYGCHVTSILNWIGQADGATGVVPTQASALSASERQELIELRPQLRQVQMEQDILAKATAWFANNGDNTFTPVYAELQDAGMVASRKRIARLMRHEQMRGVSRRRSFCVTERDVRHRPAPDLVNREFVATDINQLWVADMTYIPTWTGLLYPAMVIDPRFSIRLVPLQS